MMKHRTYTILIAAGLASSAFAQWAAYPTKAPRTADGKPDMAGEPPKMADGKPDLSGLWEPAKGSDQKGTTFNASNPLPFVIPAAPGDPPVAQFFNIGAGVKEGLPFTPWAKELRAQRKAGNNKDNPDAACLPLGLTQLHMHPQPRKIIQTNREIVILYEANGNTRQILMDGRPLPKEQSNAVVVRIFGGALGKTIRLSWRRLVSVTMSGWMWKALR